MNIKPQTGVRNYAKGGPVKSYAAGGIVDEQRGFDLDPSRFDRQGALLDKSRPSDMTQSEFNAMTPDKLYPGTEYARQWKKLSPNG